MAVPGQARQGGYRAGEPRPQHLGAGPGHLQERRPRLPADAASAGTSGARRQAHAGRGQSAGDGGAVRGVRRGHHHMIL